MESVSFFTNNVDPTTLEEMNVAAAARLQELKDQTQDQVMIALKNKKTFGLKLNINVKIDFYLIFLGTHNHYS